MRITDTSDLWWKSAIIYCLDIETYLDSDGDGVGDLAGLSQRIDYLAQLGVNTLWLMPFYPSPDRDDGYDIKDFYGVDPRLGNHGELLEVIRTAHSRGIRVIADLIINHTSDQHPWFVASRRSTTNKFRDYYIWRDDDPGDTSAEVVFPGEEDGIWTKDERTGTWYLHHFYSHQPDLNVANPKVMDELLRTVGFWLELGIDGFRVDAVPFLLQNSETTTTPTQYTDPHDVIRGIRDFLGRRKGDAMLLGEVNVPHEEQLKYFGEDRGDELHMMFDFIAMQACYLSFAREDPAPLIKALLDRPEIHPTCQWATFLRNHDELTLDKLTDQERQEVFEAFGPEEEMQVYNRGLKRRLPPMFAGDPRRVRMAYSLMFSLPGSPTLYYGEEIGMGEDLSAEGRMSVRTPMQWDSGRNGGFSSAPPGKLIQRPVADGFGPDHVNVADQEHDPGSLWSFIRTLIGVCRRRPEMGWGDFSVLAHKTPSVLANRLQLDDSSIVALHNFSSDGAVVSLTDVFGDDDVVEDLLDGEAVVHHEGGGFEVPLDGYGYRWFRVAKRAT
ncbi:alpha-amylase family protein [Tessaracoccus sp. ZS01]|uniref:alpha-amylase family protein n=1 Tax=Tessaracoccus sp. ZS01 TaxID=1906324 RepID=UPI00096D79D3|nr:alpha-amylase family protein [Tessaracoccus sp. ZS01]MCG6567880.1 trehalose synthase [Tessaracoccus sp. ZS01]OMG55361.1 trehalose synthase [Tessaracoccus sp. ZS01]